MLTFFTWQAFEYISFITAHYLKKNWMIKANHSTKKENAYSSYHHIYLGSSQFKITKNIKIREFGR